MGFSSRRLARTYSMSHFWRVLTTENTLNWNMHAFILLLGVCSQCVNACYLLSEFFQCYIFYSFATLSPTLPPITAMSNDRHDVLNKLTTKKIQRSALLSLCEGNPSVTGGFPAQRDSNAEHVSIWWRHNATLLTTTSLIHSRRPLIIVLLVLSPPLSSSWRTCSSSRHRSGPRCFLGHEFWLFDRQAWNAIGHYE